MSETTIEVLGRLALKSIQEEDQRLNESAMKGRVAEEWKRCPYALGVTYHLFETTIAYLMFRAWVADQIVVWDSTARERRGDSGWSGSVDLAIFDSVAQTTSDPPTTLARADRASHLFELKWVNSNGDRLLRDDSKKLLAATGNARRFLVPFWWEGEEKRGDWRDWLENHGTVAFYDHFQCAAPGTETRFFELAILELE